MTCRSWADSVLHWIGSAAKREWRRRFRDNRGWIASAIVHGVAAIVLLWMTVPRPVDDHSSDILARWATAMSLLPLESQVASEAAVWDGGETAFGVTVVPQPMAAQSTVSAPATNSVTVLDTLGELLTASQLAEKVGGNLTSGGRARGAGTGFSTGAGSGGTARPGFFGIENPGQRTVYVVDCSNSMNAPHAEADTRFHRLKLELVRSIGQLSEDRAFFVIFFSTQTHPMPATEMQRATALNKQRYLEWVARMRADGGTDPGDAIKAALSLRPDVILLLTDGSFDPRTARRVVHWNERRATIHTFGFGDAAAEKLLRQIADENGGLYHFVP